MASISPHQVPARVRETFFDKVLVRDPEHCWPWSRSCGSHGYGQVGWTIAGKTVVTTAHRVAWICVFGAIEDGQVVRQTCKNRLCVNPGHLETVAATLANWEAAQRQRDKTACPSGHPYDGENLMVRPGERRCRACAIDRRHAKAERLRALDEFYRRFELSLVTDTSDFCDRAEVDLLEGASA